MVGPALRHPSGGSASPASFYSQVHLGTQPGVTGVLSDVRVLDMVARRDQHRFPGTVLRMDIARGSRDHPRSW